MNDLSILRGVLRAPMKFIIFYFLSYNPLYLFQKICFFLNKTFLLIYLFLFLFLFYCLFENIVAVTFQSIFHSEMHHNNIFLKKNYFEISALKRSKT
jgi:hypothetical protein